MAMFKKAGGFFANCFPTLGYTNACIVNCLSSGLSSLCQLTHPAAVAVGRRFLVQLECLSHTRPIMATYDPASKKKRQISKSRVLSGLQEIAHYLRTGVRTVQRYERELELPILRPAGKAMDSVIAIKADLDGWVSGRAAQLHSMPKFTPVAQRSNKLKADFLQIDSQVALTFSGIALTATTSERVERTTLAARKAYDTIMRLRQDVYLTDAEKNKLDVNVARLKGELQTLGQRF